MYLLLRLGVFDEVCFQQISMEIWTGCGLVDFYIVVVISDKLHLWISLNYIHQQLWGGPLKHIWLFIQTPNSINTSILRYFFLLWEGTLIKNELANSCFQRNVYIPVWLFGSFYDDMCACVFYVRSVKILSYLVDPSGTVICENNSHLLDDLEENVSVSLLWIRQPDLWRGPDLRGACRVEGSHLQYFCSGKSHLLCIEFSFEGERFTVLILFKYEQVHDTWEV